MPDQNSTHPATSPDAVEIVRQINQTGTEIPISDFDLLGKPLVIESYVTGLKVAGDIIEATMNNSPLKESASSLTSSIALGILTGHCATAMQRVPELLSLSAGRELIDRMEASVASADSFSATPSSATSTSSKDTGAPEDLHTFVEHDPVSGVYRGRIAGSEENALPKGFLVQVTNTITNETQTIQFDPDDLSAIMREMESVSTYLDTLARGDVLLTEDDQILELHARRRSMQEAIQKFQISTQAMQALLLLVREMSGELSDTKQSHARFMRLGQVLLQRTGGMALFNKEEVAHLKKDMTGTEVPITEDFVLYQPSRFTQQQAFAWAQQQGASPTQENK